MSKFLKTFKLIYTNSTKKSDGSDKRKETESEACTFEGLPDLALAVDVLHRLGHHEQELRELDRAAPWNTPPQRPHSLTQHFNLLNTFRVRCRCRKYWSCCVFASIYVIVILRWHLHVKLTLKHSYNVWSIFSSIHGQYIWVMINIKRVLYAKIITKIPRLNILPRKH